MLYDINVHDGEVGHQHIDMIYYATVPEPRYYADRRRGESGRLAVVRAA